MDLRDPKIQKILMGVMAFFVVIYFWYTRLYTSYDNQLVSMTQEYERMITDLKNVEMKSKTLDALKEEYVELLDKYLEIEQLLPEVKQIPSFLVQLHTASSLTGTKITKIEPRPIAPESFYNVASFEIQMEGGYHEFGKFMSYVANFPFIANVSNMDLKTPSISIGIAESETGGVRELNQPTIQANFLLSTYYVKPDERLQEIEI
ncbi:MAG: hypothetical protein DRP51_00200 [Candidatus Zixiibacteriota bacterium]|nr:MAG: hypothetical protein DRP51_00200 [candidate division Zixibacteria bacterium]HHI02503.1 hypothetical protein [candidate division Zixibacteria bacterium]